MEKLMQILKELRPDVDFGTEEELITEGILDSFDVVALVEMIREGFEVEVQPEDLIPDNFNSAKAIMTMIERIKDVQED